MNQVKNFGDKRQTAFCAYCGGPTETRDHVPSRVLLDEPYPDNLPVVPACKSCNSSFSKDEEYLACLVECALRGVVGGDGIGRLKIRRILQERPSLAARMERACTAADGHVLFGVEHNRVRNVVLKLARGHATFELNEPQIQEPNSVVFIPLHTISDEARRSFETPPSGSRLMGWPEVGSRAMVRLVESTPGYEWVAVQPGQYRYLACASPVTVRIVIGEYLACEVVWD